MLPILSRYCRMIQVHYNHDIGRVNNKYIPCRLHSMTTEKDKPQFITFSGLKEKRFWTDKMIQNMLGDPDKTATNPHYASGPKMKLYDIKRVCAIEATLDTEKMRADRMRRSMAAMRGQKTKYQNTLQKAQTCDLEFDFNAPLKQIRKQAKINNDEIRAYYEDEYNAYCERCYLRGETPQPRYIPTYPKDVPPEDRWAINYLRHECTNYDYTLNYFGSHVRDILWQRIHDKIVTKYPELAKSSKILLEGRTS